MDEDSKPLITEDLLSPTKSENFSISTIEDDAPPPDNGPWHSSCCNWFGSIYHRFDKSFVTFFALMNINHGLWIMVKLAVMSYFKD